MSQFRFQFLFYKFIQIQTATSQLIYEILQKKKNSAFISILSDLSEKKCKIQKFKIYLRMTSANMTKKKANKQTNKQTAHYFWIAQKTKKDTITE